MKVQIITDENRHENAIRALFRTSAQVKIVEKNADYMLYINGIDSLSPNGIREMINNVGKTAIVGELGYISERGEIKPHDIPKPNPEFFSNLYPNSYIILSRRGSFTSPQSLFSSLATRKLRAIVGVVNDLKWNKSVEQDHLYLKKISVDLIIPTALSKRDSTPYIYDLLDSLRLPESTNIKNVFVIVDDLINNNFEYPINKKLKVIDFTEDFNFSAKINLGLKSSKSEIVIFMNDDLICESDFWLEHTINSLMGPSVGVVGGLLKYPSGTIQHAGIQIVNRELGHLFHHQEITNSHFEKLPKVYEVSAVTGAFMALKRSSLELVQNMDEHFPVNFGDIDLCFRLRENNLRCIQNNNVLFTHFESATRKKGVASKEIALLYFKWAHMLEFDFFFSKDTSYTHYSKMRMVYNSLKDRGFMKTINLIFKKVRLYFLD
jgi:GT2 family glycosyltransferase